MISLSHFTFNNKLKNAKKIIGYTRLKRPITYVKIEKLKLKPTPKTKYNINSGQIYDSSALIIHFNFTCCFESVL